MSKVGLNDRIIFLSEMLWTDEMIDMQTQNMKTEGHPIWNKEFLPSVYDQEVAQHTFMQILSELVKVVHTIEHIYVHE